MNTTSTAIALLALGALLIGGCGEQETTGPTPELETFALADTPDQLVENFARAYGEQNLDEYARVLHQAFEFEFLPEPGTSTTSTQARDQELAQAAHVFGGFPGHADDGSELAGVSTLDLALAPAEPWQDLGNDQHRRMYQASMTVSHTDGSILQVEGLQQLTVARDGEEYHLLNWRDLGSE